MKEETITQTVEFLRKKMTERGNPKTKELGITWFGGEPVLGLKVIEEMTPMLYGLANDLGYKYDAEIVTNGTLLGPEVWDKLKAAHISRVQVTLDGPAVTHNQRRPSKNNRENYHAIIENLKSLPENIHLTIRINTDKIVWKGIAQLLADFEEAGLWPYRARQINFALGFVTQYENARHIDTDWYFRFDDFFLIEDEFSELKWSHYNKWAATNKAKPARKLFRLPQVQFAECLSAVNPYGFVIDPDGNIHKCWNEADKDNSSVGNIFAPDDIDQSRLNKWLAFDRFDEQDCADCSCLPICDTRCTRFMIMDRKNRHCTGWKTHIMNFLRRQYIDLLDNPNKYAPL